MMKAPEPFLARTFDPSVKAELSRLLQHTKAFRLNSQMRARFNLACVVQDRILDAMSYLDKHREAPSTDSQFYLMMVYADNLEASGISVGLRAPDSGVKRCEHGARSAECLQRAV